MNTLYEEQQNKINGDALLSESERIQAHRVLNNVYNYYEVKCDSEDCAHEGYGDNVDESCPECGKLTLDWGGSL